MKNLNRVVLMGHLGENPISETTTRGKDITIFYIATNEFLKNKDGEKIRHTDWHKITTCGKTAEACKKMLQKGAFVLVEGRIKSLPNNNTKPTYEILATEVSFISNYKQEEK